MNFPYEEDSAQLLSKLERFIPSAGTDSVIRETVSDILSEIHTHGDSAVQEKTLLYDGVSLQPSEFIVSRQELEASHQSLTPAETKALKEAISNVTHFHQQSHPEDWLQPNGHGGMVGEKYYPIQRVGIYIPGGNVPLVSTVIMTVTLAKVAGVPEIVVTTPPDRFGKVSPHLLAALQLLDINEIYKIGGAQAIGALAYGTDRIRSVDKIFGPGNAYVNEAKRQVFGQVGVDLLPGPSEVMVIADKTAQPSLVAAALLAQAEHGSGKEKVYFLFQDKELYNPVLEEMEKQMAERSHASSIRPVLESGFFAVHLPEKERLAEVANYIAPEHLELQASEDACDFYLKKITTAGAFLVGHQTSTSLGDFAAGPSHVLPTGRSARFSSGLRLQDFLRRSSVIRYDKQACQAAASVIEEFSKMERLDGHGNAHQLRLKTKDFSS